MTFGWQDDGSFECPAPPERAKLEDWSYAANHLFAAGCEAQAFTLLCSFASPLLSFFEPEPLSAVCSIHGHARSGRSTAALAAATVWADPQTLAQAQGKALAAKWEWLGNLPVLDERLANRDPAAAAGTLRAYTAPAPGKHMTLPWCGVMLVAGGVPWCGHPGAGFVPESFPGVEVETSVPRALVTRRKAAEPDELVGRFMANRGTAGQLFLERLSTPVAKVGAGKRLGLKAGALRDETRCGERRHAIRLIAAAHVGGMLAVEAGIIEADVERVTRWVRPTLTARSKF